MLPNIEIHELRKFPDERGFFSELIREDWSSFIGEDRITQVNLSFSYPGVIRAWHRHNRGQVDFFVVLRGAMKICAYDDRADSQTKGQLDEIIASSEKLQMVRVPGYYWHGTKTISHEPSLTIYFTTRLYNYKDPDEERRPWNDPQIIDPTTKQPYDWNKPPHK